MKPIRRRTVATLSIAAVAGAGGGAAVTAALQPAPARTVTTQVVSPSTSPAATTTASASTGALSIGDIYSRSKQGVVEISVTTGGGKALGTGFVVDNRGDIVTNNHVVSGAQSIQVQFADGTKATARTVGTDASSDIAVIRVAGVDSSKLKPLTFGDSSKAQVGSGVVAIGSPYGLQESVSAGVISALGRNIDAPDGYTISGAIQTDAAINHGNSGGPLLDMAGNVIGVTAQIESGSGDNSGVGFAIPSSTVSQVASQLIAGHSVQHPFLGVEMTDGESGATVASIRSGSPAAGSGLQVGDVITALDGNAVHSSAEAVAAIAAHRPGDSVAVTVRRGGASHTLQVTLGQHA